MCHPAILKFVEGIAEEIMSKSDLHVIEVGSRDLNGSARPYFKDCFEYTGIDIEEGDGVDVVCDGLKAVDTFGYNEYDIVICTEVLEHVEEWQKMIRQLKWLCGPGGHIILTTRSPGFSIHNHPDDFWRFTVEDMEYIFDDFVKVRVTKDHTDNGVFVHARKPIYRNPIQKVLIDYTVMGVK